MLVTDDLVVGGRDLVALALAAERGGVTSVQLRLKHATPREQVATARALAVALRVPLLVNDRPDVAIAAGAAGVHVGRGDLPPLLARRVLPDAMILGVSVGAPEEALTAGAGDYWGIGPWRASATKGDAGTAIGAQAFAELVRGSGGRPCVAIGGITPEDAAAVLGAGACGVAVVSGILGADDVEAAAQRYAAALDRARAP
jgi:thiamine-phosphate pyrophosphorylase